MFLDGYFYNNINTKKPLFLAIFESLSGGDDGT